MGISLRERIVVIPFPYTFTDDSNLLEDGTKYKKKDDTLKHKLTTEIYRIAFTNMLFVQYKVYKEKGLVKTTSIIKHTASYFASQTLENWVSENCEKVESGDVSLDIIKVGYKNETGKNLSIKQIETELKELGYKTSRRCLKGWKLIEPEIECDDECNE